jgi:hypothetical protein
VTAAYAAVPFLYAEVAGRIMAQFAVPNRAGLEERIRIRQAGMRLPPDPAITPLAAGRAYYVLVETGQSERPQAYEFPPPRRLAEPSVPDDRTNPLAEERTDVFDTLLARAASALNDADRRLLQPIAAFEGLAEARIVARAGSLDYLGARLRDGHPVTNLTYPVGSGLRHVRRPFLARAALELNAGQRAQAEATLVEMISFAAVVMDEAHSAIEGLQGAVILEAGLKALEQFHAGTGSTARAEAIRLRRETATAVRDPDQVVPVSTADAISAIRRATMVIAADTARARSERWEALALASFRPCTNTSEIVFGPTEALAGTFIHARETLARFPSERQFLDNLDVASGRPARDGWARRLYGNLFARCIAMANLS